MSVFPEIGSKMELCGKTPRPEYPLRAPSACAARRNPADYDLAPGETAGSLTIIKAGDTIVEQLKSEGRPLAKLTTRKVVADHRTNTVDIVLAAEGGHARPRASEL